MALWCIIHTLDQDTRVWLQQHKGTPIHARLLASLAGFTPEEGETVETFQVEPRTVRRIPRRMIARELRGSGIERLMKILARTASPAASELRAILAATIGPVSGRRGKPIETEAGVLALPTLDG